MNNINICDCLKVVVKDTVKHYARDFRLDEAKLKLVAKEVVKTGKPQTYLWFARESGTYLSLESEVLKKGTPAYISYTFYDEQAAFEAKTIKAFLVTVTGLDGKTPIGTVQALNYAKECDRIRRWAVPTSNISIEYEKGTVKQPVGKCVLADYPKLGHIKQVCYLADDEKALDYAIAMIHNAREAG